ncbi:MAG: hypothetical protein IPH62_09485 [Ignavibacteriae bacterium]|nr:hypothetical protein [Ignavibacteriota bacterium]
MNTEPIIENLSDEDYVIQKDLQLAELDVENKKDFHLKIGLGVVYITLLLMSLFLV